MKSVYLSGPIEGREWRENLTWILEKYGYKVINPCLSEPSKMFDLGKIVAHDIDLIKKSDALLVNLTRLSTGTPMEMVYAKILHIPCFTVDSLGLSCAWHKYHSLKIYENFSDAVDDIKKSLGGNL